MEDRPSTSGACSSSNFKPPFEDPQRQQSVRIGKRKVKLKHELNSDPETDSSTTASDSNKESRLHRFTKRKKREKKYEYDDPKDSLQFKLFYENKTTHYPRAMERIWYSRRVTLALDSDEWGLYVTPAAIQKAALKGAKGKSWQNMKSLVEELFRNMEFEDQDSQWYIRGARDNDTTDVTLEAEDALMKKYNTSLESVEQVVYLRGGFLGKPSLNKGSGRESLFWLLNITRDLLPRPYYRLIKPATIVGGSAPNCGDNTPNMGDSAPNCTGSCVIGKIYDSDLNKCTGDEVVRRIGEKQYQNVGYIRHVCVPDMQGRTRHTTENSWDCQRYFYLSGKVKTSTEHKNHETIRMEAWELGLAGLAGPDFRDESYSILLSPKGAELFYLHIEETGQSGKAIRLRTYSKQYGFRTNENRSFNISGLQDFMLDMLCVMYSTAQTLSGE